MNLTLETAIRIVDAALAHAADAGLAPLSVVVLDRDGHPKAVSRQDGASSVRFELAQAKAQTCLTFAASSRDFQALAEERPLFAQSVIAMQGGAAVPAAGGLPIRREGELIGAVGISGDVSDKDEAAALAGLDAVGLAHRPD